jgi:hypothetical protein
VNVGDAIRHLAKHDKLYWELKAPVKRKFSYPILGFIHVSGDKVRYRVEISDIVDFKREHYDDRTLAPLIKPEVWIEEWKDDKDQCRTKCDKWKSALVITRIEPFSYNTSDFRKRSTGELVGPSSAPQGNWWSVWPPGETSLAREDNPAASAPPAKRPPKSMPPVNLRVKYLVMQRDQATCQICGKNQRTSPGIVLEVDHIKPLSKGGTSALSNLRVLCKDCNSGKGDLEVE